MDSDYDDVGNGQQRGTKGKATPNSKDKIMEEDVMGHNDGKMEGIEGLLML